MAGQFINRIRLLNERLTESLFSEALLIVFFAAFVTLFTVMFITPVIALGPIFGLFLGLAGAVFSFILVAKAVLIAGIIYLATFRVLTVPFPKWVAFVLACTAATYLGTLTAISISFDFSPPSFRFADYPLFADELTLSTIAAAFSFFAATLSIVTAKMKSIRINSLKRREVK